MDEPNFADLDLSVDASLAYDSLWTTGDRPNPFQAAPPFEPTAALIFFNADVRKEDFYGFCRLVGVRDWMTHYVAAVARAKRPREQAYLVQMRISPGLVPAPGLDIGGRQKLSVPQALFAFIDDQRKEWGPRGNQTLAGIMGGDGDWRKERLSFGFTIESGIAATYRIWSRAWLITK